MAEEIEIEYEAEYKREMRWKWRWMPERSDLGDDARDSEISD